MKSYHRTRAFGFSLMELCVVVAVICIVLALLFPIYGSIREKGLQTQCVSQLRQVGIAFHLYAADNRNTLPTMVYGNSHAKKGEPIPATYGCAAQPFVSRLLAAPYDLSPQAKNTLKDPRLLFCPSAKRPDGSRLQLPSTPAVLGSAAIPYIGYNLIYIDTTVGYAANLYKDYDNLRIGKSPHNPPLLWCFTPRYFPTGGTAHREMSNVLYLNGNVRPLSHAVIDDVGPDAPSDTGLRILVNTTR